MFDIKYDDSALKKRIIDLENEVRGHENRIVRMELEQRALMDKVLRKIQKLPKPKSEDEGMQTSEFDEEGFLNTKI